MKVARTDFARLLSAVAKVVEGRNTIPILATVRLVAAKDKLTATATDLDIEISGSIAAEGDFAACLDAKLLTSIVAKVAGDEITIEQGDGTATLKAGRSKYNLQTLPVDDMPSMAVDGFTAEFTEDLAAILGRHAFAMSDEATRYYLCGIFLEPGNATATNGHRLSTSEFAPLGEFSPVIIPSKTVGLVPKGAVKVRLSTTKIQVQTEDVTITSKLVDGTYPDWRRIMPSQNDKKIVVDGSALRAASERIAIVSEGRDRGVKLEVASGEISLFVQGTGDAQDSVPCTYDGDPLTIGFAVHYLSEVLASLPGGEVTMALAEAGSPALFTTAQDEGRRIVLMPRRV